MKMCDRENYNAIPRGVLFFPNSAFSIIANPKCYQHVYAALPDGDSLVPSVVGGAEGSDQAQLLRILAGISRTGTRLCVTEWE